MPPTCQIGSGPSLDPSVVLTFGTVPPTAVTQGLSSQVAVAGPGLVLPHWALAMARFCTTPQSPVAFVTGMPAAAAASGPGSLAWMYSSACIISGGATLLAASSVISLSAGVAEMTILA